MKIVFLRGGSGKWIAFSDSRYRVRLGSGHVPKIGEKWIEVALRQLRRQVESGEKDAGEHLKGGQLWEAEAQFVTEEVVERFRKAAEEREKLNQAVREKQRDERVAKEHKRVADALKKFAPLACPTCGHTIETGRDSIFSIILPCPNVKAVGKDTILSENFVCGDGQERQVVLSACYFGGS